MRALQHGVERRGQQACAAAAAAAAGAAVARRAGRALAALRAGRAQVGQDERLQRGQGGRCRRGTQAAGRGGEARRIPACQAGVARLLPQRKLRAGARCMQRWPPNAPHSSPRRRQACGCGSCVCSHCGGGGCCHGLLQAAHLALAQRVLPGLLQAGRHTAEEGPASPAASTAATAGLRGHQRAACAQWQSHPGPPCAAPSTTAMHKEDQCDSCPCPQLTRPSSSDSSSCSEPPSPRLPLSLHSSSSLLRRAFLGRPGPCGKGTAGVGGTQ